MKIVIFLDEGKKNILWYPSMATVGNFGLVFALQTANVTLEQV